VGRAASLNRAAAATLGFVASTRPLGTTTVVSDDETTRGSAAEEDEEARRREEDLLHQVLEMSMADLGTDHNGSYNEARALAQAIEASLMEASSVKDHKDPSLMVPSAEPIEVDKEVDTNSALLKDREHVAAKEGSHEGHDQHEMHQSPVQAHSAAEAQAVVAPSAAVRHVMMEAAESFLASGGCNEEESREGP